jgi:ubiquinone/menaquinone biosynthesis C-methylase UbiE
MTHLTGNSDHTSIVRVSLDLLRLSWKKNYADRVLSLGAPSETSVSLREYFDCQAQLWENKYALNGSMRNRMRAFTSALSSCVPPGCKILDFGSGSGDITASCSYIGFNTIGVDQSSKMIERARERFSSLGLSFLLIDGSHPVLPFRSESFGAFIASSVLEYIPNLIAWLSELRRVCQKDAIGVITVPNLRRPIRLIEAAEQRFYGLARNRWPNARFLRWNRSAYLQFSTVRLREKQWRSALTESGWHCFAVTSRQSPLVMLHLRAF